jgi:hypothetical protein
MFAARNDALRVVCRASVIVQRQAAAAVLAYALWGAHVAGPLSAQEPEGPAPPKPAVEVVDEGDQPLTEAPRTPGGVGDHLAGRKDLQVTCGDDGASEAGLQACLRELEEAVASSGPEDFRRRLFGTCATTKGPAASAEALR